MTDDILQALKRIEAKLDVLLKGPLQDPRGKGAIPEGRGQWVASEKELRGQYGDRQVKFKPPRWDGAFTPGPMSTQEPEFLEALASFYEWQADKADENGEVAGKKNEPKSKFIRKDAALARGWAKLLRQGGRPAPQPAPAPEPFPGDDRDADDGPAYTDEIPF